MTAGSEQNAVNVGQNAVALNCITGGKLTFYWLDGFYCRHGSRWTND